MTFQFSKEEIKYLESISSIDELSNLLKTKTNNEFAVVETALVQDINERLQDNIICINKLNEYLFSNWQDIIKTNRSVTDKWQSRLKQFRT